MAHRIMVDLIEQHRRRIESLCSLHGVLRLDVLGSAVSGTFDPRSSDLDFFVEFEDRGWNGSSKQYFGLLHGLEDLFGRKIDLVECRAITSRSFLEVADVHRQTIYAATVAKAS